MANATDLLSIDTPENVTFDYDVAGIGSRFLAALVDTLIVIILQVIVFFTFLLVASRMGDTLDAADPTWILGILFVVSFIFFWGYYIFFEILWNGQTPGKRWVGLRVIRVDGTPVTAAEVVIRNLVRTIDMLPGAYGVGVVTMFVNSQSRRLGDLAAGTLVVHDNKTTRLEDLRSDRRDSLSTLHTTASVPEGFPIERLNARELELIENFLIRRYQLANRDELAGHILRNLATRLQQPLELKPGESPEAVLIAIYKQLNRPESA